MRATLVITYLSGEVDSLDIDGTPEDIQFAVDAANRQPGSMHFAGRGQIEHITVHYPWTVNDSIALGAGLVLFGLLMAWIFFGLTA